MVVVGLTQARGPGGEAKPEEVLSGEEAKLNTSRSLVQTLVVLLQGPVRDFPQHLEFLLFIYSA